MPQDSRKPLPQAVARIAPDGRPTPRQRRRILIEMCLRRIQPGAYTSPEFFQQRTTVHTWPDLHHIFGDIPWLVTGGVATRLYMPERSTNDIDVIIRRSDCQKAWSRFREAGFSVASALDAPYFVARAIETPEVDVICADLPWLEHALLNPRRDAANLPIIDLPYLILMKLRANRGVDIGDMTRMLGLASDEDLDRVHAAVTRYSPQDVDDLNALILLGRMEMGRANRAD
jgi:hypothetical protein